MDILETYFKEKQSDWYEITTLTQCFFNLTPSRQELHGLLLTESATEIDLYSGSFINSRCIAIGVWSRLKSSSDLHKLAVTFVF